MLQKKKLSNINKETYWVNGYEFGLFCAPSTCVLLAKTMQVKGKAFEEMIAPLIQLLAKDNAQLRIMQTMYWDLDTVRAFASRQDGHFFLKQGDFNGYELGLVEDEAISRRLGVLARYYTTCIADVVHIQYFKAAPLKHIKAFYG